MTRGTTEETIEKVRKVLRMRTPKKASELAEMLGIAPQTVTIACGKLEERGEARETTGFQRNRRWVLVRPDEDPVEVNEPAAGLADRSSEDEWAELWKGRHRIVTAAPDPNQVAFRCLDELQKLDPAGRAYCVRIINAACDTYQEAP